MLPNVPSLGLVTRSQRAAPAKNDTKAIASAFDLILLLRGYSRDLEIQLDSGAQCPVDW